MAAHTDLIPWRVGRSIGRTIYLQTTDQPTKGDILIGIMDTPALAALVVAAVNQHQGTYPYTDGQFTVLGPQIFTDKEERVINWRGRNYTIQSDQQ